MKSPVESSSSLSVRRRIFESACFLFSERGLRGTHVRDICRHADVNAAALCYHFGSKEGLYEAVVSEAGRQLAAAAEDISRQLADAIPEERIRSTVVSLFKKLGEEHAWITRLFARLLADPAGERPGWVGLGFERYFLLLQADIKKLLSPQIDPETVRLHALSVISQCLFYCFARETLVEVFPHLQWPLPAPEKVAAHVSCLSIEALRQESQKRDHDS
ncbi:MAG: CerR family C-terminal domain-containing protein [Verrucomicrobiota bacterium]|jgi:AcrR family transcriptional regulator